MSSDQLIPPTETTYFMRARGKIFGPFSVDQLQTLRRRGQLSRVHEVSIDRDNWRPASSYPELFEDAGAPVISVPAVISETLFQAESPPNFQEGNTPPDLNATEWFYSIDGRQYGPVGQEELRRLVKEEEVLGNDLVWNSSMSEWTPSAEIRELQPRKQKKKQTTAASTKETDFRHSANHAFCTACGSPVHIRAEVCPECGVRQRMGYGGKTRMNAALLALFLGGLGAHRFYLGQTFLGLMYILFCWTFIPAIVAFVEGIAFLCQSDYSFDRQYNE